MKAEEIRGLLVSLICGAAGGTAERWFELIGPVEPLNIIQNIHSNWRISPPATGEELHVITTAAEIVRAEHPYVSDPPPSRPIA